ncbi:MAG: hypothetical protein RQ723_03170, partial [Desulfuromonadales bacterium]|nr:hypothetical protein [Desulfuromonadales bacterium]
GGQFSVITGGQFSVVITINLLAGLLGRQLAQLGRPIDAAMEMDDDEPEESEELCQALPIAAGHDVTASLSWDF